MTQGECNAVEAIIELTKLAESGNLEMQGYFESIRALSQSIRDVGLQQPLRVLHEPQRDGGVVFRLVDGERRFWAFVYQLCANNDKPLGPVSNTIKVPTLLHNAHASAEEIQRAQWAANLYHESVCAVDYAEMIWAMREAFFARLDTVQRVALVAQLGDPAAIDGLSANDLAIELTSREIAKLTGKTLKRRMLYHYLSMAEHLSPEAKALGRAFNISLRQLISLMRMSPSKQLEMLTQVIQAERGIASAKTDNGGGTGRPSSVQRGINGCISLNEVLQQLSDKGLSRSPRENIEALLNELARMATEVERAKRLLTAHLSQSNAL